MVFSRFRSSRKNAPRVRDDELDYDKQWAKRYILDPLTAPEPSQETGLGTSHVNPYKAAAAKSAAQSPPSPPLRPDSFLNNTNTNTNANSIAVRPQQTPKQRLRLRSSNHSSRENIYLESNSSLHRYPTPPPSASPTDQGFDFHPSNPFSTSYQSSRSNQSCESFHRQRDSRQSLRTGSPLDFAPSSISPPSSPASHLRHHRNESASSSYNPQLLRTSSPISSVSPNRRHRRFPSVPINTSTSDTAWGRFDPEYPRNQLEKARRLSLNSANSPGNSDNIGRSSSQRRYHPIAQRFPGDMSHRPLDMIKRDAKAADRPHRHRKRISDTDTIDALDTIGGAYHHGGPYDATLISRNLNKKYSPVAAVEESNMEAIRATPRENIIDSLTKHVPLQGTASIPSGSPDMSGKIMEYEEGADLMREPDAAGGAYKRWDGIQYHPDDLKGKGEPSFTIERDLKKNKSHRQHLSEADAFEMRPGANRFSRQSASRQRSTSQDAEGSSSGATYTDNPSGDLRRSNTTGKKLSEGLKRRFGSIRRKKEMPTEVVQ